MNLDFAVLADGVTTRPDGKLDLFGAAFDRIFAFAFPARHPTMSVAIRVSLSALETRSTHRIEVDLIDPDGRECIPPIGINVESPEGAAGTPQRALAILQLNGVEFQRPGDHAVVILWDGNEVQRLPITVVQIEPPNPEHDGE